MWKFDSKKTLADKSVKNPPKVWLVMDGQWGSCGKGALAGHLAQAKKPDMVVCNFGPNAGHTFVTADGERIMTQQLPTGMIWEEAILMIGPGAIIDPEVLGKEITKYNKRFGLERRLMIHERAAVITPQDKAREQKLSKISSTQKGVGSAQAKKVMRVSEENEPLIARDSPEIKELATVIDDVAYKEMLRNMGSIQVETAQGFELSLNHGSSYPYCTSRDVTPETALNEVGIPMRWLKEVYVAVRTFPIRVGHAYDEAGNKIGDSGPVYDDMKELDWAEISRRCGETVEEKTTVTGKVRRVFTWSDQQFKNMLEKFSPCKVFVNYANYLNEDCLAPELLNEESRAFIGKVGELAKEFGSELALVGFGPTENDIWPAQDCLPIEAKKELKGTGKPLRK